MTDKLVKIYDEGVRIGEERAICKVVMNMIESGEPMNRIQDYTGLSSGEINSLKQNSRKNDSRSF